jgi:hypothetical protein
VTARALHPVNRGARETSRSFSDGALLARLLRSLADCIALPTALLAFAMVAFVSVVQAEGTFAAAGAADADSESQNRPTAALRIADAPRRNRPPSRRSA